MEKVMGVRSPLEKTLRTFDSEGNAFLSPPEAYCFSCPYKVDIVPKQSASWRLTTPTPGGLICASCDCALEPLGAEVILRVRISRC